MNSIAGSSLRSNDMTSRATAPDGVSLFRLYTLRLAYLIMAAGIGVYFWPNVIHHTSEFAIARGIQFALLAGLGLTAALGLRYPLQMLPILLFELTWKAIYLLAFALPLWSAHQIDAATAQDIKSVLMVVIFIPLIPWRYVFAHYLLKHGDRWK
ncbi:MAG TPA: hypothetical protein VMU53_12300 [Candidatus Sulfotelmatobacter sp.]|nr:hypothetical protein [Candidatus Sulfotelmatobacter sp.]